MTTFIQDSHRKAFITLLSIVFIVFVAAPTLFIFSADPCHVFHKPFSGRLHHGFTPETRCQNAGLINSWLADPDEGFDAVMIGASTSENFQPEYIAAQTPWHRVLKLTMVNMFPVEHNIVARRAIATGRVKHIFWEVLPMLHHAPISYNFDNIAETDFFPAYLYNYSRLDDYRYIFNWATLSGSLDVLFKEPYFEPSIDRIRFAHNWCATHNICDQFFSGEEILDIQNAYIPVTRSTLAASTIKQIHYRDFDNFIYPVLSEHCNKSVSFDIYFPPYSLLWFAQLPEKDFYFELYLLRHVVEETRHCKNIRVFAFYNELNITADLSNYKDSKHFYGNIHNRITDDMANGRNQIRPDMLNAYEEAFIHNINTYRPYGSNLLPH
jgi:hypothetical protein